MRHRYLFLAFLLMMAGAESATAQKVIFKMVGCEPIKYDISKMEYIMFEEATPDEHEWVDLALPSGTQWATCTSAQKRQKTSATTSLGARQHRRTTTLGAPTNG